MQKFPITIFLILGMLTIGLGKIGVSGDDKNLTTINVLDFGAVGDGNTDDSQVILSLSNMEIYQKYSE